MNTRVMPVGILTGDQVHAALIAATAAPSPPGSLRWRLRCTATVIELYADPTRSTRVAGADQRGLMLACGAALLNLRLAIRVLGVHPVVRLVPDPHQPDLLATVQPQGRSRVTPLDRALAAAIPHRTHSRPFTAEAVPRPLLTGLRQAAKAERAWLATLSSMQLADLRALIGEAHAAVQRLDPALTAERAAHRTGRGPGPADGPHPLIAVVGSLQDLPLAQLQAGQAMQRVLLVGTTAGLSASFLSPVVEVRSTRRQLRELIGGGLWPQAALRLGYGSPVPAAPRRDFRDVVDEQTLTSSPGRGRGAS